MKTFLILASLGVMVMGGQVDQQTSRSPISTVRTVSVGKSYRDNSASGSSVDLRQLLDAVEGNNNLQQYGAPAQQQYAAPQLQQQYVAAPILQQYAPASVQQQYGAPLQYAQQAAFNQQPAQRYVQFLSAGVPAQQYAPAPAVQYGAVPQYPTPKFITAVASLGIDSRAPAGQYGAPAQQSISYAPVQPIVNYGAPRVPEPRGLPPQPLAPTGQYGAPAALQGFNIEAPQPAISYGLPSRGLDRGAPSGRYGAPSQLGSNYGPPNAGPSPPQSNYGAPQGNQFDGGRGQENDFGGGNFNGGADGGLAGLPGQNFGDSDDFAITRDVSVHIPPADSEGPPQRPYVEPPRRPRKKEKHYKIIFIRAPTPAPPEQPYIPEIPEQPEQKTLVYVLVKKPEAAPPIIIPTPEPPKNSQPEVYFIKYRHPSDGPGIGGPGGDGPGPIGPGPGGNSGSGPSRPGGDFGGDDGQGGY